MSKPEVRFKGYMGEWEERKLGDILENRKIVMKQNEEYHRLAFAAGQGIIEVKDRKTNNRDQLTKNEFDKKYLVTELDDIVYNPANLKYGAIDRNKLRKGLISPIYVTFTTNQVPGFIERIVISEKFRKKALQFEEGSVTKRQSVNANDLLSLDEFISIYHEEQEKIGAFFDNLDHLITLHQRKCEETKTLKKYMIQKMFPQNGANVPEIRFDGFTDDWEQHKLSTIITEKFSNGVINKTGTEDSNVKHINVINMYTSDKIHTEDLTPSSHDENTIQKCNVEVGDIFMTRSSLKPDGIAEANVLLDSGIYVFDDHLIRMKVDKSKYDPMFVKINLGNKMIKKQFIMKSKTTAFTTIGQEDISECVGMFPFLDEQKKIGEYFQKLDHLITLHQRKMENLQKIKKSMIEKMFV